MSMVEHTHKPNHKEAEDENMNLNSANICIVRPCIRKKRGEQGQRCGMTYDVKMK